MSSEKEKRLEEEPAQEQAPLIPVDDDISCSQVRAGPPAVGATMPPQEAQPGLYPQMANNMAAPPGVFYPAPGQPMVYAPSPYAHDPNQPMIYRAPGVQVATIGQPMYVAGPHGMAFVQPPPGGHPPMAAMAGMAGAGPALAMAGMPMPMSMPGVAPMMPVGAPPVYYTPAPATAMATDDKHMLRMGNFIFIGTYGKIRAMEVSGNSVKHVWTEELKGCGYHMVHLKLFVNRGQLYAATNGHVFCLDALTGKTIWRARPDLQHGVFASDLVTMLLTYDGTILITGSNGYLVAFNAASGQIVWEKAIEHWMAGSNDAYAMLEHNGILYVGNEGFVYAYYVINGQLRWKNGLSGFGFCPISLAAYIFTPPGGAVYDILFVGTYGYVLALDAQNGSTRHHINLDGTGYKPVALLLDPQSDSLYTATSGELRCFRANSMTQMWKSDLPGMGYSYGHSLLFSDVATILIGMHGKIAAISKSSGKTEWTTSLPGCGYHLVTVASMPNPDAIVCASSGKLFGLNKKGHVCWNNDLPGMGYAEVSVSTSSFNTDFNSTTLPQNIEMQRRQRRKNNGGLIGAAISSS